MTKRTKLACVGSAVILFVTLIGSSQATQRAVTVTIKPGTDATQQCTADIPRPTVKKGDTVIWTAASPGPYKIVFKPGATPFSSDTVDKVTNDPHKKVKTPVILDPGTCGATGCSLPYEIFLNGSSTPCNTGPVNSHGIIVKPGP